MVLQRLGIRVLDSLQDFHDDGREAVGVEVDFLVVWDLAEVAKGEDKLDYFIRSFLLRVVIVGSSIVCVLLLLCWPSGGRAMRRLDATERRSLFDSPNISKSSRKIGSDGAAEEVDLFESGGHFGFLALVQVRMIFCSCCCCESE
jgi:hypothetical protein